MKYRYVLKGLDCAHCAEQIRSAAAELEVCRAADMNFLKKELCITAKDGAQEQKIFESVCKTVKRFEPDVQVIPKSDYREEKQSHKSEIAKIIISAVLFIVAFSTEHFASPEGFWYITTLIIYAAAYLINAADVAVMAFKALLSKNLFNENTLMLTASIGAILLGEYEEAVAVMLFYAVGELFQRTAVNKSRRSICALIRTKPEYAEVLTDDGYVIKKPEEVDIGAVIRVKAGEKIPLDSVVVSGCSSIDTSAVTGESLPRDISTNDRVPAGAINLSGAITLRTTARFSDSTVYKMLEMVENAVEKKTKTENFISVFARYYTPAVVAVAALLSVIPPLFTGANFAEWIEKGLIFLVISCPCALVISVPLGYFAGIGKASSKGILIKGSNYLEAFSKAGAVIFDKTGTLTTGEFSVSGISAVNISEQELLKIAAYAESGSNHPIARAITSAYGKEIDLAAVTDCTELAGKGISAEINGRRVLCGNARFLSQEGIICEEKDEAALYVGIDGKFCGSISVSDNPKEDSAATVSELKKSGVKVLMLTGDNKTAAEKTAAQTGIDEYHCGLLPQEKSRITALIKEKLDKKEKVIFIGDGINDAPVIACADIGVAMGVHGADSAIETADAVFMKDSPRLITEAIKISRKTNKIVLRNIILALGIKLVVQILGILGVAGMWAAVFADVGVSALAIFNSLRILRK